jgi:DNA invertase Pin-like site-specific DNA recombinase
MSNLRVACYARVSTKRCEACGVTFDKHESLGHLFKGQDPGMQLRELLEYCERRGWEGPVIFVDRVSSGQVSPELERLKQLCRQRKVDVVMVYRFDRFARSTMELVNAVEEFRTLGIQFISLHEQVDTTCPQGKLVFTIFAAVAEFERELIKERVRSGIAEARAKGKRIGRAPVDRAVVSQVRVLVASGQSLRQVGHALGISVATVHKYSASAAAANRG